MVVAIGLCLAVLGYRRRLGQLHRPDTGALSLVMELGNLGAGARLTSRNYADFEGGNIGRSVKVSSHIWNFQLRSDNDDALPLSWRQWFYFRIDDLPVNQKVTLNLSGLGMPGYFLPFYSLDNVEWIQFPKAAVTRPTAASLQIVSQFPNQKIWFASYVPYHYTRLTKYLAKMSGHPSVTLRDIGRSPSGLPIPILTITDSTSIAPKQRVILHARTHPGEVGGSYVIEGLVNYLLSDHPLAKSLQQRLIFTIIPMVNVDGVIAGNNRTTPSGVNLEGKWLSGRDLDLDHQHVPSEILLLNRAFRALLATGVPVSMALNLHSSAGEPTDLVFAFPHFGPSERGYTTAESQLFEKQIKFISLLAEDYGTDMLAPPPSEGGRGFVTKKLPESWWWRHFQDRVMALTLESTYGFAGRTGNWMKPRDLRRLGESLAVAISRYHENIIAQSGIIGHKSMEIRR